MYLLILITLVCIVILLTLHQALLQFVHRILCYCLIVNPFNSVACCYLRCNWVILHHYIIVPIKYYIVCIILSTRLLVCFFLLFYITIFMDILFAKMNLAIFVVTIVMVMLPTVISGACPSRRPPVPLRDEPDSVCDRWLMTSIRTEYRLDRWYYPLPLHLRLPVTNDGQNDVTYRECFSQWFDRNSLLLTPA
jgi:hypothetical protein